MLYSNIQDMKFLSRIASDRLKQLLRSFPIVMVHGPRQCGKSTLVRHLFPNWKYVDLERPADFSVLNADIEGFFEAYPRQVVLDEAQCLPQLFNVLRHVVDQESTKGRFILLGSAGPSLLRDVSQTLAGRVGLIELTPFRAVELSGTPYIRHRWFFGGYPPVKGLRAHTARVEWLENYVSTFLERDLPALGFRLAPQRLRRLWTMLTHVHGQLLNVSDLARSMTVSTHTVNHYLDILEGAFLIRRCQPLHVNLQKRLTKSPKLYVRDTGLLHFLAGLRQPVDLETWPRRGHSFEGMVIEEIAALATDRLARPEICFWRTQAGAEVDMVIGHGNRWTPIEIKLGTMVDHYAVAGLRQLMTDLNIKKGWVVCSAKQRSRIGKQIEIVPWQWVVDGQEDFGFGRKL